jgi:hypothetical protein
MVPSTHQKALWTAATIVEVYTKGEKKTKTRRTKYVFHDNEAHKHA